MLFSLLHKFYLLYINYLKDYYKLFIKNYFQKNETNELDLSSCGNYIFLIVTNKEFKSFKEQEEFTINLCYDENNIDKSLEKFMKSNNINKKLEKNIQVINKNMIKKNIQNINSHNARQIKGKALGKSPSNQVIKVNMKNRIQMKMKGNKNINKRIIKNNNLSKIFLRGIYEANTIFHLIVSP